MWLRPKSILPGVNLYQACKDWARLSSAELPAFAMARDNVCMDQLHIALKRGQELLTSARTLAVRQTVQNPHLEEAKPEE